MVRIVRCRASRRARRGARARAAARVAVAAGDDELAALLSAHRPLPCEGGRAPRRRLAADVDGARGMHHGRVARRARAAGRGAVRRAGAVLPAAAVGAAPAWSASSSTSCAALRASTVKELAHATGLSQRAAATSLGRLHDASWVRREKRPGTEHAHDVVRTARAAPTTSRSSTAKRAMTTCPRSSASCGAGSPRRNSTPILRPFVQVRSPSGTFWLRSPERRIRRVSVRGR